MSEKYIGCRGGITLSKSSWYGKGNAADGGMGSVVVPFVAVVTVDSVYLQEGCRVFCQIVQQNAIKIVVLCCSSSSHDGRLRVSSIDVSRCFVTELQPTMLEIAHYDTCL